MASIPYMFFDISYEPNTKMYLWDPTPLGHHLATVLNDTLVSGKNETSKFFDGILEEHVCLACYVGYMASSDTDDLCDIETGEDGVGESARNVFRKFFPRTRHASDFGRWEIVNTIGVPPKVCIPVSYMTEV